MVPRTKLRSRRPSRMSIPAFARSHTKSTNFPSVRIAVVLVGLFYLSAIPRIFGGHPFFHRSSRAAHQEKQQSSGRILLWDPEHASPVGCNGVFTSGVSPFSDEEMPEILVREALPDTRSVSRQEYREQNPTVRTFERIQVLVSAHLSTVLFNKDEAQAYLLHPNHVKKMDIEEPTKDYPDLLIKTDYVYMQDYEDKPGKEKNWTYSVGDKTRWKKEFLSWNVIASVIPHPNRNYSPAELHQRMLDLSKAGVLLVVPISYARHGSDEIHRFNARLSLSCVYGWQHVAESVPALKPFRHPRSECSGESSGAFLAGGSPVRGIKAHDPKLLGEVAHFAVRSLAGAAQFDHVAVQISAKTSISQDREVCKGNASCMRKRKKENREYLLNAAKVLEDELVAIGAPESVFGRISLLPWCRLGAGSSGTEAVEGPCTACFAGAQFLSTSFLYTLFSSEFKWSASWDIDEYLVPRKTTFTPVTAEKMLDDLDIEEKRHFWIARIPLLIQDHKSFRPLTNEHVQGYMPKMKPVAGQEDADCMALDVTGGKSAIRCDIGTSLKVHAASQLRPGMRLEQTWVGMRTKVQDPILIHARLADGDKKLPCEFSQRV